MSNSSDTNKKDTIIIFSTSGMGHLIPIVELSKILLSYGFSVTIAVAIPQFDVSATTLPFVSRVSSSFPSITFHLLPTLPSSHPPVHAFHPSLLKHAAHHLLSFIQESTAACLNIRALVLDMFCTAGLDVGRELNIPTYLFYTSGAAVLVGFLSFPYLQAKNEPLTFRDLGDEALIDLPGIPPIPVRDLPDGIADRGEMHTQFMGHFEQIWRADAVIVNTFEWLERRAVAALKNEVIVPGKKTPPVYCVGPLVQKSAGAAHECLLWLDAQPEESVVFLCFGSSGSMPKEQIREIAEGLERSGCRFLWVVRGLPKDRRVSIETTDPDLDELLPEGFVDRTKGRGMVVSSWAPQREVLAHAAVGAFVSHCGWNSALEAMAAGKAVVGWPMGAEQRMNKHVLVEEAKVAVAVERDEIKGIVKAEEIEKKIRMMMESEEGMEVRKRAKMAKEMAEEAWTTRRDWEEIVRLMRK